MTNSLLKIHKDLSKVYENFLKMFFIRLSQKLQFICYLMNFFLIILQKLAENSLTILLQLYDKALSNQLFISCGNNGILTFHTYLISFGLYAKTTALIFCHVHPIIG